MQRFVKVDGEPYRNEDSRSSSSSTIDPGRGYEQRFALPIHRMITDAGFAISLSWSLRSIALTRANCTPKFLPGNCGGHESGGSAAAESAIPLIHVLPRGWPH
jgi:hypothetical protein